MRQHDHEPRPNGNEHPSFRDRLRELLPDIAFEETPELTEARTVITKMLSGSEAHNPDHTRAAWGEYAKLCEEIVDENEADHKTVLPRAGRQIATLVHKALIFERVGNDDRCTELLTEAIMYALADAHKDHFATVASCLWAERNRIEARSH